MKRLVTFFGMPRNHTTLHTAMTSADMARLGEMLRDLARDGLAPGRVLVFSPAWDAGGLGVAEDLAIGRVWPDASVVGLDRGAWDLDGPRPAGVPDAGLGVICNTFMCSRDPALWLRHLSAAVPLLVVQDLAVCRRGPGGSHCATDSGDVARYSVSSHGITGATDPGLSVFDLSSAEGWSVRDARPYADGGALKLVAALDRV